MLFIRNTAATVAPGVYAVDVAAKPPGQTFMLYAAVDAVNPPKEFIAAVEGIGFKQIRSRPYTHKTGKKIIDLHFGKAGTDLFEGWTAEERDTNLHSMEKLLAGFDIKVTPRVMTLAEAYG